MAFLGIDFGLKKIGLALSEGKLTEPLMVIENRTVAMDKIAAICQEYGIKKVIIGLSEGKMTHRVRRFGENLSQKLKLPVLYHQETLTTQEAIAKMVEAGKKRKYRREKEDACAAALILQHYLEKEEGV